MTISSCNDDSFASFEWFDGSTDITQFDYVINDGTHDIDFMTGQNTLHNSCNPQYTLHKEEEGGAFVEYTGTVVSFDSEFTKSQIITTASDYSFDQEVWRMRLSVASVTDLVAATNPSHIYFTVKFVHPCRSAVFHDNESLDSQLDSAVVNGIGDETTISPFDITFPGLTGYTFECGAQTVTVVEPALAYSSGPVSNFISVTPYDASFDNFRV